MRNMQIQLETDIYLDAGTTYSKIISNKNCFEEIYLKYINDGKYYYVVPSSKIKEYNILPKCSCGHMASASENEIIALANGSKKVISGFEDMSEITVLDLGSRDAKWIKFKDGKFHDMDWNISCASSTGATVEMLLKFYDVKSEELAFEKEKFAITCGIFGMEKIMDSISSGVKPSVAISKFVHGIAYNAWNFAKKTERIYLSGGFCENNCLVESLKNYCDVVILGRFVLCEGLVQD